VTTWRKNEAVAARRRCVLNVSALADGSFAPADTSLTGKVFYRAGDDTFIAASGTLSIIYAPLVQADNTFTVDAGTDIVTLSAADPPTGAGPFRATTTTTLPGGLAVSTDYWWIRTGTSTGKLAATLADALAGTEIDITDAGTGTHTLADTASTEQPVPGKWLYEATQTESDVTAGEVEIAVIDPTWYAQTFADIDHGDADETAIVEGSHTRDDLIRGIFAMVAGKMLGVDAVRAASGNGDVDFYADDGVTIRVRVTYSSDGRPTITILDLT
jgi:hypothetical protein